MPVIRSGARLAISYGYVPCTLGLCGPQDRKRKKIITRYLKNSKKLEAEVRKILQDFKGAFPYYKLIARSNNIKDPLNVKVVEAYWTGNSLLEKVKVSDFAQMMKDEFLPLGKMPESKIKNLSKRAIPFHSFHVLQIGSVTGRFKETRAGLDLCRVSWGKVREIKKGGIMVLRQPLKFGKKILLAKNEPKTIKWNKKILPAIKIGDWVSIHWNTAIEKLDAKKLKNLKRHTLKILKIAK